MNQEETRENIEPAESVDASESFRGVDNLPIESIGSYARLKELLTDEEKENTTDSPNQS